MLAADTSLMFALKC